MPSLFNKLKGSSSSSTASNAAGSAHLKNKKDEPTIEPTPLEKLLQNAGPLRQDGSDKFFGLENFGNTCYCNSIVQALFFSQSFRENVVNYPPLPSLSDSPPGEHSKVKVSIRPSAQANGNATVPAKPQKALTASQVLKARQAINAGYMAPGAPPLRPEDKPDSPEYKKKQAMIKGPVLELAAENPDAYGMPECTFTGLKDIFTALIETNSRTGVLSPQRFLDIFKRDNENFRSPNHQDAHEFYMLVLNDVISSVEAHARRMQEREDQKIGDSLTAALGVGARAPGTGWVHDIFEGVLTSETKCLTCETASQRDETFLDLSIDLEEHSSVTSCLYKFSAEEMLCERNKFHCDQCGGLQEAEKRMKVKKLPKVLALHLKRFKYTEDYSRLQKLFHRVVYPYHLRMFNTTDDAEDPDRMYELYAVVIHIGSHAYQGHYVSVIKTQDRGWLLFDDEMVEPVDKHFVRNFFGDKPGMACAYVLFYQETTFQKVREEQDAEGLEEVRLVSEKAGLALRTDQANGVGVSSVPKPNATVSPAIPADDREALAALEHAETAPDELETPTQQIYTTASAKSISAAALPPSPPPSPPPPRLADSAAAKTTKTTEAAAAPAKPNKESRSRQRKELKAQEKAQEKARKAAEKEEAKLEEKKRAERLARIREARKNEQEELERALQESKQLAAEEEKRRRKETGEEVGSAHEKSPGFFNRAGMGLRPKKSRRSLPFLSSRDKGEKGERKDKIPRSGNAESGTAAAAPATPSTEIPAQNGGDTSSINSDDAGNLIIQVPEPEREPPERSLRERFSRERFSFSLGRKRSQRSVS